MLFKNLPLLSRVKTLCGPVAAASLLLFAPGCGRDHNCNTCSTCTSVASDSSTYRSFDSQTYASPAPAVYTDPALLSPGVRGPRSQNELNQIYSQALINPVPPAPPRVIIPQGPPTPIQPEVVIVAPGEGGWNVPISREWKHIVVHHSASNTGNAAAFDSAHRAKGWDGLGYHFVIGNGTGSGDGQVEVGYRWTKQLQGAHAGNYEYNQHGIGICLVGDFEHGGPPSPAQMASLRTLLQFLQAKSNIPPGEIIGHGNVPGRNTECPGRHLDMAALRASVGGTYIERSRAPAPTPVSNKKAIIKASVSNEEPAPANGKAVAAP